MAVIYVDKTCYTLRRIQILHISCVVKNYFNKIFEKLIDFIWKNDTSEEIR